MRHPADPLPRVLAHSGVHLPPDSPPARSPVRRALGMVLRAAVTIGALAWLFSRGTSPTAALDALRSLPPWVFAIPFSLLLANSVIHAVRLKLLLAAAGAPLKGTAILMVLLRASFVGSVAPRGGADIARIGWLGRETGDLEAVLASTFTARVLELVPWSLLLAYGLAWGLMDTLPTLGSSAAVFLAAFTGVVTITFLLARHGEALAVRLPVLRARAVVVARSLRRLSHSPGVLVQVTALGAWIALNNVLSVWILFRVGGAAVPWSAGPALVPAMDTVISLPITVSGLGLREGIFVYVLEPWGISESAAVALALTRWSGEIGRALVGGLAFLVGPSVPTSEPVSTTGSGASGAQDRAE